MHNNNLNHLYEYILEHSDDLIIFLDRKFKIKVINSAAANILGVSTKDSMGKSLFAICRQNKIKISLAKKDLDQLKKIKHKALDGHITYPSSSQKQKKSISWKLAFINKDQKNSRYFLIIGKDISGLEKYKKEARLATSYLKGVLENLPEYIYWKDAKFIYRGCNKHVADYLGLLSPEEIAGKTDNNFGWARDRVITLRKIDKKIIETGVPNITEEIIPRPDGSERIMLSSKSPLMDDNNRISGIVGISVDITDYKRTESLLLENKLQKTKLSETVIFKKTAEQLAHDIRSPLASLLMIVETCKNIPESERISLREVATSIDNIANNLLVKYKKYDKEALAKSKAPQSIHASLTLSEILSEKRHQYKFFPTKFEFSSAKNADFVFIKVNYSDFSRMMSNLINNAVEAIEDNKGVVSLKLSLDNDQVKIYLEDNGKGMSKEVIKKIMNNLTITSGKKHGSGIGLAQVRSTIQANHGIMSIKSKIDKGTKITLAFPKAGAPNWITERINLNQDDMVIILDDDPSIHEAWKVRFEPYKSKLKIHHFKQGSDAIEFINNLTPEEKERVFLLSDYELIEQNINGLQIIENLGLEQQSILVTSHYNDMNIRETVCKMKTKILPKQLASTIHIKVEKKALVVENNTKKIDLVILDDDQLFADSLATFFQRKSLMVDTYYNPKQFLNKLSQYAKNTKICLDNDFKDNITGVELAKQLHKNGYTNLYLLSGKDFEKIEIPDYLTIITKGDMEALDKLI